MFFFWRRKKLGVDPRDCIVFEDILGAVKSAKSVRITVCSVCDMASESDWDAIGAWRIMRLWIFGMRWCCKWGLEDDQAPLILLFYLLLPNTRTKVP